MGKLLTVMGLPTATNTVLVTNQSELLQRQYIFRQRLSNVLQLKPISKTRTGKKPLLVLRGASQNPEYFQNKNVMVSQNNKNS